MIELERVYWLKERIEGGGADVILDDKVVHRLNRDICTSLKIAVPNKKLLEFTNNSRTMLEILENLEATMINGFALLPYRMKPLNSGRIIFKGGESRSLFKNGLLAWFLRREISDVDGSQLPIVLVCYFVDDTGFPICAI